MVRQTIGNYLEEHNVPAASVSSRQDLSRHLEKAHPSLILLDLRLGQDDGLDVLREIRSHSNVSIIIMTGHSREEVDRVVGLELDVDSYLANLRSFSKPRLEPPWEGTERLIFCFPQILIARLS